MLNLLSSLTLASSFKIDTLFESIIFLILGIIGLYLGAEFLVKGSSRLARAFGIKPLVIGLTLVAFGTSAPELVVSLFSGLGKAKTGGLEASLGNIVGSNIANIGLVLGITALIRPLRVRRRTMKVEFPFMIAITVVFCILAVWNQGIQLFDGVILLICFIVFVVYCIINGKDHDFDSEIPHDKNVLKNLTFSIAGLLLLGFGGFGLVEGSIYLAIEELHISPEVVGLTVMAFGTSLPELITSIIAQLRGYSEISVGNIIGSNIFNIALVLGIFALVIGIAQPVAEKFEQTPELKLSKLQNIGETKDESTITKTEDELTTEVTDQTAQQKRINYIPVSNNTLVWNFGVMLLLTFLVWVLLFFRREKFTLEEAKAKGINAKQFSVVIDKKDGMEKVKTLRIGRIAGLILLLIYLTYAICLYSFKGWAPWNYDENKPSLTQDYMDD